MPCLKMNGGRGGSQYVWEDVRQFLEQYGCFGYEDPAVVSLKRIVKYCNSSESGVVRVPDAD
jgi:hypothetical protein